MNFPNREQGQGIVEYSLLLAFIAIIVMVILIIIGPNMIVIYARIMGAFSGQTIVAQGNEAIVLGMELDRSGSGACTYSIDGQGVVFMTNGDLIREGTYTLRASVDGAGNYTVSGLGSLEIGNGGYAPITGTGSFSGPCGKVTFSWQ